MIDAPSLANAGRAQADLIDLRSTALPVRRVRQARLDGAIDLLGQLADVYRPPVDTLTLELFGRTPATR